MSQNFKFISVVDTKLLTIANVRFYHFQTFIRVLRRVRNFVVISGTKESLRDGERSGLTVHMVVDVSVNSAHCLDTEYWSETWSGALSEMWRALDQTRLCLPPSLSYLVKEHKVVFTIEAH